MKKFIIIYLLVSLIFIPACSYKEQFEKSDRDLGSRQKNDIRELDKQKAYGFQVKGIDHHQFDHMKLDLKTGYEISRMNGVAQAYVLMTNRNAYVALAIDNTATGTSGKGNVIDTNNVGTSEGVYDAKNGNVIPDPRNLINETNSPYAIADPKNLSSKLKQNVGERVRQMNPKVIEIFISANKDFINTMSRYHQETWRGNSLDPYVADFREMVKAHFVE
jgi:YhcN/YlaJ family sporulation lipoprotein